MPEVIFHEKRRRRVSKQMIQVNLRKKVKNDSIIKVTIRREMMKFCIFTCDVVSYENDSNLSQLSNLISSTESYLWACFGYSRI